MIHQFSKDGIHIAVDVNSGSIHIVDDITNDLLKHYNKFDRGQIKDILKDKYSLKEIDEAIDEIKQLEKDERLFTEDIFEKEVSSQNLKRSNPVVKALCLHIAHDCNLKCKYCFAGEGEYHGDRSLMSAHVGKKALDFLVANSGNRKNLEIDFFGGEPTLNFEVVKEIVLYGRSIEEKYNKNFRFTFTTNGVLLNGDIIEFANKHMNNVVLSIDGRKEVNDNMRKNLAGKGSYDKILPNIKAFVESRDHQNYYVRGTYTANNLDFSEDVFHLADLGFEQISVEPVVAEKDLDYALKEEHIDKLCQEYDKLVDEFNLRVTGENKHPLFNFFHFNLDIDNGSCAVKRIAGCGAGCEYMSVTPNGDLYPCHQFTGLEEFKIGSVFDGIQNNEVMSEFGEINIYSKPECKDCWAKFFCSGGCAANAYQFGGSINSTYEIGCKLQKKRIESAIYIKAFQLIKKAI